PGTDYGNRSGRGQNRSVMQATSIVSALRTQDKPGGPMRLVMILMLAGWLGQAAAAENQREYRSEEGTVQVEEVVGGLENPWALAFLPDGEGILITERPGQLRLLNGQGELSAPLSGVPKVYAQGQGGLLD